MQINFHDGLLLLLLLQIAEYLQLVNLLLHLPIYPFCPIPGVCFWSVFVYCLP